MDSTPTGLVIPTPRSLWASYELLLPAHTKLLKVNLDRMEVYLEKRLQFGTTFGSKVYTLPVKQMLDEDESPTTDRFRCVYVYAGSVRHGAATFYRLEPTQH